MGRFNQIRAQFNNGSINPNEHVRDIEQIVKAAEDTKERSCNYLETMYDQQRAREKEEEEAKKRLDIVDANTVRKDQQSTNREPLHIDFDLDM